MWDGKRITIKFSKKSEEINIRKEGEMEYRSLREFFRENGGFETEFITEVIKKKEVKKNGMRNQS